MNVQLSHCFIAVDDHDKALAFYHDVLGLEVRTDAHVTRIEQDGAAWRLETKQGPIGAKDVIVATGYNGAPFIPPWPGREGFAGGLIHSSQYLNPAPFRDRDVLVVGAGNSGAEIAHDVIDGGAKRSRLSVRTPPQIVRRATAAFTKSGGRESSCAATVRVSDRKSGLSGEAKATSYAGLSRFPTMKATATASPSTAL